MSAPRTEQEARDAITAILAGLPEHDLPKPDLREEGWVHFGGLGFGIGSGKVNGNPAQINHRSNGLDDLFFREVAHRHEAAHWAGEDA